MFVLSTPKTTTVSLVTPGIMAILDPEDQLETKALKELKVICDISQDSVLLYEHWSLLISWRTYGSQVEEELWWSVSLCNYLHLFKDI